MIAIYAAAVTLLIAGTLGTPGYVAWASVWMVIVYRTASRPRGEDMSPDKEKERFASSSSSDSSPLLRSPRPQTLKDRT